MFLSDRTERSLSSDEAECSLASPIGQGGTLSRVLASRVLRGVCIVTPDAERRPYAVLYDTRPTRKLSIQMLRRTDSHGHGKDERWPSRLRSTGGQIFDSRFFQFCCNE